MDRPILSLDRPFTYQLGEELGAGVGSLVQIPFHGKLVRGWVLGPTDDLPKRMLGVRKLVSEVRFFDERMLELLRWVSERYVAPLAAVIARSHPPRVASEEPAGTAGGAVTGEFAQPAPAAGPRLPAYRHGDELRSAIRDGGGAFVVRPAAEEEQALAVEAVGEALRAGRTAIVLVPESAPLPATASAVAEAFGDRVALYLGGDKRRRYRVWLDILARRYPCVVGTRPAVFAPLEGLGLLWVARESHPGHREERSPYYHVRDVAMARAALEGATCVMAALCPSSEAAATGAPEVAPVRRSWVPVEVVTPGPEGRAPRLVAALRSAGRSFLYEPLPGYGIARVCRACGEPAACSACGGPLRSEEGEVRCTVCEAPGRCARCGSTRFGIARGGAERVEEWLSTLTGVRLSRGGVAALARGRPAAVVGGPEAVRDAGPLHLDLVGVLDADLAARRPGLSAQERSLAIWMEAVGWARPEGRAVVQTRHPSDPAVQSLVAGSPARFHRAETERRRQAGFPVGAAVFRVAGDATLPARLEELAPITLLSTGPPDRPVCLIAVRPEDVPTFGRAARRLAEAGALTRVEAEPHL